MGAWDPLPKPAFLTAASPKQALITFHSEAATALRKALDGLRETAIDIAERSGEFSYEWLVAYDTGLADMTWEEGSISAMLRDKLKFHDQSIEHLTSA